MKYTIGRITKGVISIAVKGPSCATCYVGSRDRRKEICGMEPKNEHHSSNNVTLEIRNSKGEGKGSG